METQAAAQTTGAATSLMGYIQSGGPYIMWPLVAMLAIAAAITIWRLIIIIIAMFNIDAFFKKILAALQDRDKGIEKALSICKTTPGPLATVIHAGLSRAHRGVDHVEKAIESAGAIEMAFLENGLVWLATIANLAPLIGFYGTVAGMIIAFNNIAAAGDVEPTIVASGISMALITTAGGLIVAIPTQIAYNLCIYLIEKIMVRMEEASSKLVDTLVDLGYDKAGV
jgi:biopolymer transport protein ExbB